MAYKVYPYQLPIPPKMKVEVTEKVAIGDDGQPCFVVVMKNRQGERWVIYL